MNISVDTEHHPLSCSRLELTSGIRQSASSSRLTERREARREESSWKGDGRCRRKLGRITSLASCAHRASFLQRRIAARCLDDSYSALLCSALLCCSAVLTRLTALTNFIQASSSSSSTVFSTVTALYTLLQSLIVILVYNILTLVLTIFYRCTYACWHHHL